MMSGVKVNMTHGNQMTVSNTAVIGVRPSPHIIADQLSPRDEQAVFEWVALNSNPSSNIGKAGSTPSSWAQP